MDARAKAALSVFAVRVTTLGLVVMVAALVAAAQVFTIEARAQTRASDHWVSTWATAQQLMPATGRGQPSSPNRQGMPPGPLQIAPDAPGQGALGAGLGTQGAPTAPGGRGQGSGGFRPVPSEIPASLADQTIRMVVRTSIGGRRVRISLSNMQSAQPLSIGAAHVALDAGGGRVTSGSDRTLTFGGSPRVVIPPGALVLSDPVGLIVSPLADLAVSLYLPVDTGAPTNHSLGLRTAYVSKGDVTGSETMPEATPTLGYLWLSSVDVLAPANAFTIVTLGDSITDGYGTTLDANRAWPTLLAKRLSSRPATRHIGVVNQGISGNQVLRNGAGVSALARFDRDVLSRPGVKWVVLLEGINDINIRGRADGPDALAAEDLIAGYQQIIARAHSHGIKVLGATIMPDEGVPTATARGESIREAVNTWIRTSRVFDAVVDFDQVVRDTAHPSRIRAEFDPGDHIHPNDLANQAMADAFDLTVFRN